MSKAKKPEAEAEEPSTGQTEGDTPAEGEEGAPKKGKRKLIIIAAAALLVLVGAGLFFSGILGGGEKTGDEAKTEEASGEHGGGHGEGGKPALANAPIYYELPQFLVNLNSATGRVSFLKMSVTLELRDKEAVMLMDASKPRIVDTFNTYLRELRPSDIQGSEGIFRLRTELMSRLNSTIEEGVVKDVLFGEIIVQ